MDSDICNKIVEKYYDPSILKPSFVTKENVLNTEIRKSSQTWLPSDCWVAGMLKHFIESANINYYNFDLTGWKDSIQFTVYDPPDNRYNWHIDMAVLWRSCSCGLVVVVALMVKVVVATMI